MINKQLNKQYENSKNSKNSKNKICKYFQLTFWNTLAKSLGNGLIFVL